MYAAFRWVESPRRNPHRGDCRREVLDMYLRSGLEPLGQSVRSGAVTYDLLQVTTAALRERMKNFGGLIERLESKTVWQLNFPFRKPPPVFMAALSSTSSGPNSILWNAVVPSSMPTCGCLVSALAGSHLCV